MITQLIMENFTQNNESKFEEALSITLRRKQETGNKKKVKTILRKKYFGDKFHY